MATLLQRIIAVTALGLVVVVAVPAVADAHTRTKETTNIRSVITSAPDLEGVSWTVHTGGFALEVINTGDRDLIIEGYDGEPYLRVGPAGVHRNLRSPATYLNRDRYERVTLPPVVDATAAPDWQLVHERPRVVWHDHRTHWMSPEPPRFVTANGALRGLMGLELVGPVGTARDDGGAFLSWAVPVTHGGDAFELRGELLWVDASSPLPWLLLASLLVLPALRGLRSSDPAARIRPAAYVVLAVATINGLHLVDDLVAFPADPLDELFGLLHTAIFLTAGIGGPLWALRVRTVPLLALGVGSGAVLYHQGLVHLPMLFASQFPTIWPDGLVRLTIGLGVLQAVVVTVVIRSVLRSATIDGQGVAGGSAPDPAGTVEAVVS
jgi:hypothetical protein